MEVPDEVQAALEHCVLVLQTVLEGRFPDVDGGQVPENWQVTARRGLRLRAEPNTDSEVLDVLPYGTAAVELEWSDKWMKTNYKGRVGWLYGGYLSSW